MKREPTAEEREKIDRTITTGDRIEATSIYISITECGLTEAQDFIKARTTELQQKSPRKPVDDLSRFLQSRSKLVESPFPPRNQTWKQTFWTGTRKPNSYSLFAVLVRSVNAEVVVLVDEYNRVLGTMPKADVHGAATPLHRGFSSYLFRSSDRHLLLQQRSAKKRTWPLIWSNTCCGHPGPGESNLDAAKRRLKYELGIVPIFLEEVAPHRYCVTKDGTMENEICPILIGVVDGEPVVNPEEVESVRWMEWNGFIASIERNPTAYSDWCIEQAKILEGTPRCKELLATA